MSYVAPPDIQLNLNVRGMPNSATMAINERSQILAMQGREIYRLGLGQSPFPVPEPIVQELRDHAHQKDYLPVRGLERLRIEVANYHGRRHGIDRCGEDVLIGPGSKELMFLLQLTFYGDLVIPTPAWVSYAPQARIIGHQVHMVPTMAENNWCLSPEDLEQLCTHDPGRPRVLILNYPSNPTGCSYSANELEELARVARKHRIVLLSDEIYGELQYDGEHHSIAQYYPEGTIVSSGLSKWCGAGGWRLGTFLFPPSMRWLQDAMSSAASETFTSTSAPIQYAAVQAFCGSPYVENYLTRCRLILREIGKWSAKTLRSAGIQCIDPVGAFYLFPDFSIHRTELATRGVKTSRDLCEQLLQETGVATLPGIDFGRDPEELSIRLAYVDFDGSNALQHAEKALAEHEPIDETFVFSHCGRIVSAIHKVCSWAATSDSHVASQFSQLSKEA